MQHKCSKNFPTRFKVAVSYALCVPCTSNVAECLQHQCCQSVVVLSSQAVILKMKPQLLLTTNKTLYRNIHYTQTMCPSPIT